MKAYLHNYRQSPRKVRLVADLIRGKSVGDANTELSFLIKRAALPFQQLLASAVANAKMNFDMNPDNLYVSDVRVDKGVVLKRMMPRAMGRASRINKRTSHVLLVLAERGGEKTDISKAKVKKTKTSAKAETKEEVKAEKPKVVKAKKLAKAKTA
jgi:large subunit ribosomal protein L22